jgi:hypothetical protein
MFGKHEKEPNFRECLVFAIDPLHTSNREQKSDLVLLLCTAYRCENPGRFRQGCGSVWQQAPGSLIIGYSAVAALLYTGNDENS